MAVSRLRSAWRDVKAYGWGWKDRMTKAWVGQPKICSIEETYEKILQDQVSVSRFGDGEFKWMAQLPQFTFQTPSPLMRQRLLEISKSDLPNHIVCLSDTFGDLKQYNSYGRKFWGEFMGKYRKKWMSYLLPGKTYYNTNMTRPYMDYADKTPCANRFTMLKKIWEAREVVLVEGEKSRLGIGNDLFASAKSVRRILAPATNAFDVYEEIYQSCLQLPKEVLVLIALGPTATILAYDLAKVGYQALDIGHVDVEYEWFRMGALEKVPLANKYVNESLEGREVGELKDLTYQNQIIAKIEAKNEG